MIRRSRSTTSSRSTRRGDTPALAGISLRVGRGEIFGLLGPNGSGKTTAVRILVTLLRKTSGLARVGGFDTERESARVHRLIGYAGQRIGIDDDLTVHENLVLQVLLHEVSGSVIRPWAEQLVEALALGGIVNRRAGQLSEGLRRRVDLAQALVHRPAVVFLDEPTTGLDPQSRNAVWEYLRELSREGMTIFLTTQYLEEADRACDRVAIIDEGRLITVGPPATLKREVGGGRLKLTLADEAERARAAQALAACAAVAAVEPGAPGEPVVIHVDEVRASLAPVVRQLHEAAIELRAVEHVQPSLEDVFLQHTGARPRVEPTVAGAISTTFAIAHGRRRRR